MTQDHYPEAVPKGLTPVTQFTFDIENIKGAKKDITLQSEALTERIKRISDKCLLSEHYQVIPQILNISRDPEDLKRLAKGLGRIADIIGEADELERRATVIEVAEKDPSWLAWAFGSFDMQDSVIESFLNGETSDGNSNSQGDEDNKDEQI